MDYFETARESSPGRCSDDSCPCPPPGTVIEKGEGYLYISQQVVDFRRDALTLAAFRAKIDRVSREFYAKGVTHIHATSGVFNPILMCEQGARRRGLDLRVAAEDARRWWESGLVPLRPTPLAQSADRAIPKKVSNDGSELFSSPHDVERAIRPNRPGIKPPHVLLESVKPSLRPLAPMSSPFPLHPINPPAHARRLHKHEARGLLPFTKTLAMEGLVEISVALTIIIADAACFNFLPKRIFAAHSELTAWLLVFIPLVAIISLFLEGIRALTGKQDIGSWTRTSFCPHCSAKLKGCDLPAGLWRDRMKTILCPFCGGGILI